VLSYSNDSDKKNFSGFARTLLGAFFFCCVFHVFFCFGFSPVACSRVHDSVRVRVRGCAAVEAAIDDLKEHGLLREKKRLGLFLVGVGGGEDGDVSAAPCSDKVLLYGHLFPTTH
jgi:hypothetical protein